MKEIFDRFVERAIRMLEPDSRFCGLAIGGSWVIDEIDEYSDLDLVIVCTNDAYPEVVADRFGIAENLGALISAFTGEHVGEPKLLICLYKDPIIHVDLKFVSLKDVEERTENPVIAWARDSRITNAFADTSPMPLTPDIQWIEDRFWTWVHYGALRLGRGELFELVGFLGYLRCHVLGPLALAIAGHLPHGVRKIERYLPDFSMKLQKTVPSYDSESCYMAMSVTIELYKELRYKLADNDLVTNVDAEQESIDYLRQVSSVKSLVDERG